MKKIILPTGTSIEGGKRSITALYGWQLEDDVSFDFSPDRLRSERDRVHDRTDRLGHRRDRLQEQMIECRSRSSNFTQNKSV